MNMLENLLGGGKRQQAEDFVRRYETGHPGEGYDDDEVLNRYQEVSRHLPPEEYEDAAADAFARMSPQERAQFGRWLKQQGREQGYDMQDLDGDGYADDPRQLARASRRMQERQPEGGLGGMLGGLLGGGGGGLGGMLGGGGGGGLGGMLGGGGRGTQQRGGGGELLDNPIAKAALAGVAAMALKKMMSRR